MCKIFLYVFVILLAGSLIGCVQTVGESFDSHNVQNFAIGKTTKDEALKLFGKPLGGSTETVNENGNFSVFKYEHASAIFFIVVPIAWSETLFLEFKNNVAIAYIYVDDSTNFFYERKKNIKEGSSNKADVLKQLGEPAGKARCPSTMSHFLFLCQTGKEVWKWTSQSNELGVSFTEKGIVSHVTILKG